MSVSFPFLSFFFFFFLIVSPLYIHFSGINRIDFVKHTYIHDICIAYRKEEGTQDPIAGQLPRNSDNCAAVAFSADTGKLSLFDSLPAEFFDLLLDLEVLAQLAGSSPSNQYYGILLLLVVVVLYIARS